MMSKFKTALLFFFLTSITLVMGCEDFTPDFLSGSSQDTAAASEVINLNTNEIFTSIQEAVNDPDTQSGHAIEVGAGVYQENQVIVDKHLTITCPGNDCTIDGGSATGITPIGTVFFNPGNTNVGTTEFSGFTIVNYGTDSWGIHKAMSIGSGAQGSVFNIHNNSINGGFYVWGTHNGNVMLHDNTITANMDNPILMERHSGPSHIYNNTINNESTRSAIYYMTYNATEVSNLQKVENNTITASHSNGAYGIGFKSYILDQGDGPNSAYDNIEIINNQISGIRNSSQYGIQISNAGDSLNEIGKTGVLINGNTLTGSNAGDGLVIKGLVSNVTVTNNTIMNFSNGVKIKSSSDLAPAIQARNNKITNNLTMGVDNETETTVDFQENWWGNATGPYNATLNPSGTGNAVSAYVDFAPWFTDEGMTTLSSISSIAVVQSPVPGSDLTSATETFAWNDSGASQYWLWVGTTEGGHEIYSDSQGTNTSRSVSGLPQN
ncbi:MAG: hypothetical protein GY754_02425, partial [bacterium]|nr:hypothetical protein [bacterium]